jgi:hypothetical protein
MSTRDLAVNSALDLFTGRFKAVRSMGLHRARRYKGKRFRAFWRTRHGYNFKSTRRACKRHPWRAGFRVARHGYGAYRSFSGRNLPDF